MAAINLSNPDPTRPDSPRAFRGESPREALPDLRAATTSALASASATHVQVAAAAATAAAPMPNSPAGLSGHVAPTAGDPTSVAAAAAAAPMPDTPAVHSRHAASHHAPGGAAAAAAASMPTNPKEVAWKAFSSHIKGPLKIGLSFLKNDKINDAFLDACLNNLKPNVLAAYSNRDPERAFSQFLDDFTPLLHTLGLFSDHLRIPHSEIVNVVDRVRGSERPSDKRDKPEDLLAGALALAGQIRGSESISDGIGGPLHVISALLATLKKSFLWGHKRLTHGKEDEKEVASTPPVHVSERVVERFFKELRISIAPALAALKVAQNLSQRQIEGVLGLLKPSLIRALENPHAGKAYVQFLSPIGRLAHLAKMVAIAKGHQDRTEAVAREQRERRIAIAKSQQERMEAIAKGHQVRMETIAEQEKLADTLFKVVLLSKGERVEDIAQFHKENEPAALLASFLERRSLALEPSIEPLARYLLFSLRQSFLTCHRALHGQSPSLELLPALPPSHERPWIAFRACLRETLEPLMVASSLHYLGCQILGVLGRKVPPALQRQDLEESIDFLRPFVEGAYRRPHLQEALASFAEVVPAIPEEVRAYLRNPVDLSPFELRFEHSLPELVVQAILKPRNLPQAAIGWALVAVKRSLRAGYRVAQQVKQD